MRLRRLCNVAVLAALATLTLCAQEFRATITGRVTDASGSAVPAAKVSVTNTATNETSLAASSVTGDYTVPFLKPGRYSVSIEAAGFKKFIREDIEARVNDRVTVDAAMEVGAMTENVTITAEAPLLEEASASRGAVLDNLRVTELPLNGRNPINFANLTPGVIFSGNPTFKRPFDNGDNINFSINGGLRQTNSYMLDGIPDDAVTDTSGDRTRANLNIAYIPTVDALQEFRVVTNFYDAQYGRTGGGIVNITTKSGGNEFHGTAYEFLRRYQLDANSISNNASVSAQFPDGRPRYAVDPVTGKNLGGHKLDQYGTHITGPVRIPGLYDGRNKTFFSFGVENYKESTPSPSLTNVPSAAVRQGDFSGLAVTIYDPMSIRENPAFDSSKGESVSNPRFMRDAFPGNRIPQARWNKAGSAILNAYPAPNTGAAGASFSNFIASPNLSKDDFRNWIGRVDQNFGESVRMFFRYAHNRRDQIDNGANGYTGAGQDAQDPLVRLNDNAAADAVVILSPNTIMNLRGGYTRFIQAAYRQTVAGYDITKLGFPASFAGARFTDQPPRIEVDQYPAWGARNPSQNTTNLLSFMPSISLVRGSHYIKVGADVRDVRANAKGGSFLWGSGQFTFNRSFTQRVPGFDDGSGNAVASLLLGYPTGGMVQYVPQLAYRWGYYGFYLNDDYKVSSRLTLNLGLRYDVEGTPTERYDRMNRGFAFGQASPLATAVANANKTDCPACAALKGGLLFTDSGNRNPFDADLNNWQPRVGAAYRLRDRTVLRGGYGLFYFPDASYGGSAGFASDTPFIPTQGGGVDAYKPFTTLDNPYPTGFIAPTGSGAGLNTFAGRNIVFTNAKRTIPYVHSFSVGLQHQLPFNMVLDASYVGSRSLNINTNQNQAGVNRNLNVPSVEQLNLARQDSNYFNAKVANPFAGLLPGTSFNGATISRRQLLLPYPQFGEVNMALEPIGKLWYDALQVQLEKRYSAGLTLVGSYTWSKNSEALTLLNHQDAAPAKVLAAADRPHRMVVSGVYQLPFGRGRQYGGNVGRGLNAAIGGWEYNFMGTVESGTPMDLPGPSASSNFAFELTGDPALANQGYGQWLNGCTAMLNGTVRQPNAAHNGFGACTSPVWQQRDTGTTLRTAPLRLDGVRNPWAQQWDMSLVKKFSFTERCNAEFRAESFNIFNTP
ncbi:MAG TPA: carboxypeptidase-like regulatory domain-containing protein, partial [Bryobacteraceae bacterium]|nr:carboxypeptidase-like regulatory domain-containing protein [Bryobacteraceae bacterium]